VQATRIRGISDYGIALVTDLEPTISPAPFAWDCFDAYLFDIDGTLLNSRDWVHYNSFHSALRQVWNCELKIDGVPLHGNTDIGILRAVASAAGVSTEEFSRKLPRAILTMQAEVGRNVALLRTELCPSVSELLQRLHSTGKLLAVTSGNLEPIGWAKLRAAGIASFFSFGSFCGGSTGGRNGTDISAETRVDIFQHGIDEVRRRLGKNARVCFIGDTPADILAARSVCASVIAVATGIFDMEALRQEQPDLCLPGCAALLEPHRP
jgi:phosphoglycolate phosphatase-like HAD superfamily hydrolase